MKVEINELNLWDSYGEDLSKMKQLSWHLDELMVAQETIWRQ